MGLHPRPLTARHAATMVSLQQAVAKLQSRTSGIDSGFPLATLPGVIDHGYSGSGNPKAYVNGATELTGPYSFLGTYTPVAGQAVFLQPVGAQQAYVITGSTSPPAPPAGASTAWQTLTAGNGFSGTVQYRFTDTLGINVQFAGSITLPGGSSVYNDVIWGNAGSGYIPSVTRNWTVIPLAGTSYGNPTYPGGPHGIVFATSGELVLWGIPGSLNGQGVDISGIYAL